MFKEECSSSHRYVRILLWKQYKQHRTWVNWRHEIVFSFIRLSSVTPLFSVNKIPIFFLHCLTSVFCLIFSITWILALYTYSFGLCDEGLSWLGCHERLFLFVVLVFCGFFDCCYSSHHPGVFLCKVFIFVVSEI